MDDATLARAQKAATALKEGRFDAALKIAKAGLKSAPKHAYLANLAGLALVQIGNTQAAAPYFLTACRSDPAMIEAPRNLAQALILLGQTDKALSVLGKALVTWPRDVEFRYLVASAHHGAGYFQDAIKAANDGLEIAPKSAPLYTLRALARAQTGDCVQADQDFQRAVELDAHDPETRRAYAQFLAFHAQVNAAFEQVNAGLAGAPDQDGLLLQKASLHQARGETDDAIACYEDILAEHQEHPLALNGLALMVSGPKATQIQKLLAKVIRQPTVSRETKVLLGFALARLAQILGHADVQRVFLRANASAAKLMPYDADVAVATQANLMAPFVGQTCEPATQPKTPSPIFVVGLIRSGTSLVERILAQHPSVAGLGELARARHLADAQAADFAQNGVSVDGAEFATQYHAALPPVPDGTTHFVDKMPDNFKAIGYLLNAFPNATVLEIQRDPRDVALSMWASYFPTTVHSYANAMPAMAQHMNLYASTMQQWRALFPDRVHGVSYEGLVTEIEAGTRHLAALCGLAWHADMSHPERSTDSVLTASVNQVRQPVHARSVGKWKTQGELLKPFMQGLNPDLWPNIQSE